MNTCNHLSKAMLVVVVIFLLGACNTSATPLATETVAQTTNMPTATQTKTSTNTSTPEPKPTLPPTLSTALPPWKKLIIGTTNTGIEIQGDRWVSVDRGVDEKFAWITLTNPTSNHELTQVVAYLGPNEDRTALFGEYPSGARELEVESSLEKYDGIVKIIGFESGESAVVFVELQLGTNLYGVQSVIENPEKVPLEEIYDKDVKGISEYLIEDAVDKEQLVPTPVPLDSKVIFRQAEGLLLERNLEGWLYDSDHAESSHVCRSFENSIPYGVKLRTLINCLYNTSDYGWKNLQEMAEFFTREGDEILESSIKDDSRLLFGYTEGRVYVVMLYFDKEYSFTITTGFAQRADKPSDLFNSDADKYLNLLLSENIERLEASR